MLNSKKIKMKQLQNYTVLLILVLLSSCVDLTEINENPNNVSETHPQLLLTNLSKNAFQVGSRSALYASRMLVQTDGESSSQYYNWSNAGFDDYNRLRDVKKMMEEAERINSEEYKALAKFFKAYYFYKLTLTFGNVPYKEALLGEESKFYTPKYDSQKDVFKGILNDLNEANEILKTNNNIIAGDIIFGGSALAWQKLINSFRLKVLMTLSKQEADADLNIKSTFASIVNNDPIISSNADNAQIVFVDQAGSRYTEFNSSSYGSGMYMASTFIDLLKERQDPRLFIYSGITKNAKEAGLPINDFNAYNGGNPIAPYNDVNILASEGKVSKVNLRYSKDPTTEPHNLLSYAEVEFILAEAALRGWITTDAKAHYENAIKASFNFYNTYAKGYESYVTAQNAETYMAGNLVNFDNANTFDEKLAFIITQKYFTSFLQGGWRMYFDHLRTGYPSFPYLTGATPPTRWMYPQDEYKRNSENVAAAIKEQFSKDGIREIPWWLK